jgi:NADH dehydrogenase [ubiquinone] 1 alpha subcomplex assembly factor 7
VTEAQRDFAAQLAARLRNNGPISVADYMAAVTDFYYAQHEPFGAGGDFITAPEISQVFGELIGLWCADLWQRLGAPDPFLLVELGPGRGTLMSDALRVAKRVPGFAAAMRLHLVERSKRLCALQAAKLATDLPVFHDTVASLPRGRMLLIANEFLDALPIQQFARHDGAWYERCVAFDNDRFVFARGAAAVELPAAADGAIAERCPQGTAITQALAQRIAGDGGAALFIDYGYYPSALGDTLQAMREHKFHPVLEEPGSADLTAHVDFGAIARAAELGGAKVYGPVTQGGFLKSLGIEAREAALLKAATPAQQEAIRSSCQRLVDPAQMGALFKVLALGQKDGPIPDGFGAPALRDGP